MRDGMRDFSFDYMHRGLEALLLERFERMPEKELLVYIDPAWDDPVQNESRWNDCLSR